ncbi:MAG: dephospho-CoA kinase [Sulfurospirillum sp.]|nr:dephospho-CoA kinase [Sulfurospirillum sp.]
MTFKHACVITGGIATGKSTVCSLLRIHGFHIVDADLIAKEQIETCKRELVELFGGDIFDGEHIDRAKLAQKIFTDASERAKLNKLLHPKIRGELYRVAQELDQKGVAYIIDIPLYFETNHYDAKMSALVYAPQDIQKSRLMQRDGLSCVDAQKRLDAQMPIEQKKTMADCIIDNSKDLKHLQNEVERFVERVKEDYASSKI